jgi:hypothetical protein
VLGHGIVKGVDVLVTQLGWRSVHIENSVGKIFSEDLQLK